MIFTNFIGSVANYSPFFVIFSDFGIHWCERGYTQCYKLQNPHVLAKIVVFLKNLSLARLSANKQNQIFLRFLLLKACMWNGSVFGWMSHPTHVISPSLQAKRYVLILMILFIPLTCLKPRKIWKLILTENRISVRFEKGDFYQKLKR